MQLRDVRSGPLGCRKALSGVPKCWFAINRDHMSNKWRDHLQTAISRFQSKSRFQLFKILHPLSREESVEILISTKIDSSPFVNDNSNNDPHVQIPWNVLVS